MKILIADDDVFLRDIATEFLSDAGYAVLACEDGKIAWECLQKEGADLAVLDVNMPEMDGLELLDLIRGDDKFKDMPVILLTGAKNVNMTSAKDRGADDYLAKPVEYDELIKRIKLLAAAFGKGE